jgi:hypothetical protein
MWVVFASQCEQTCSVFRFRENGSKEVIVMSFLFFSHKRFFLFKVKVSYKKRQNFALKTKQGFYLYKRLSKGFVIIKFRKRMFTELVPGIAMRLLLSFHSIAMTRTVGKNRGKFRIVMANGV